MKKYIENIFNAEPDLYSVKFYMKQVVLKTNQAMNLGG